MEFTGNSFSPLHCAVWVDYCLLIWRRDICATLHFSITNQMPNFILFLHVLFVYSINGNDTCTELLLEAKGSNVVNLADRKKR